MQSCITTKMATPKCVYLGLLVLVCLGHCYAHRLLMDSDNDQMENKFGASMTASAGGWGGGSGTGGLGGNGGSHGGGGGGGRVSGSFGSGSGSGYGSGYGNGADFIPGYGNNNGGGGGGGGVVIGFQPNNPNMPNYPYEPINPWQPNYPYNPYFPGNPNPTPYGCPPCVPCSGASGLPFPFGPGKHIASDPIVPQETDVQSHEPVDAQPEQAQPIHTMHHRDVLPSVHH